MATIQIFGKDLQDLKRRRIGNLRGWRMWKRSQTYRVSDGIARAIIQFVKKCGTGG